MLASGQVSILILLGYIIMAAKLSGAMGGVLLYLTEIFYLDARIARIGEIKNHELQGGEMAVLSDFNVEIKDVCFSYQKDTQVIRHASFTAEQGQVTALVGPSGCGKTTMLKLISRLYDADSGTVQIGGTDIREIHTDSLFKYVSIVFQEVILFNTSIMENIRLGRLDAVDMNTWYGALMAGEYDLTFYNTAGGSFDPATDMSNMAPGAMGDPILCQFSAFFENPEIFAELDSTSDSQRVQEIYGMILNGIADQNLLVPVTGTHDLALWNTDKITGYDFYTDASYVDIASVHVK